MANQNIATITIRESDEGYGYRIMSPAGMGESGAVPDMAALSQRVGEAVKSLLYTFGCGVIIEHQEEEPPCPACGGKGWLLTLNVDRDVYEVQRCDICWLYGDDRKAGDAMVAGLDDYKDRTNSR